jgi:hypothetical protein
MESGPPMTSSQPASDSEVTTRPVKSRRRSAEFWRICWLTCLSSLLISLYAVFVSQRLAPTDCQHELDQAALDLADEIGRLSIRHGRFGNVGVLDLSDGARSQLGLNKLQATLRLDELIASQLGYEYIVELVRKDARDAAAINRELARLERELASPQANSRTLGRLSFADFVRRRLSQTSAGRSLRSLKISLGGLRNSRFGSQTPLPAVPLEQAAVYAERNNYKTHTPVPVAGEDNYQFYEVSDAPGLITSLRQFSKVPDDAVASVVMLEAEFDVGARVQGKGQDLYQLSSPRQILTMRSCAIAGAPPTRHPGSVFMLSFPQGYLTGISCLNDLFSTSKYEAAKGSWYQAFGGEVPGQGILVAAPAELEPVSPNLAAMRILYHYIFSVGPSLVPANLRMLLNEPIGRLQASVDEKSTQAGSFNSGLFRDTGNAEFVLRQQSSGDEAKKLISSAFSSQDIDRFMPPFSFPLLIDAGGSLNLPQEIGFDHRRLKAFLDALYRTNIAGIETMEIGNTVISRMQIAADQSLKKMSSLREELRSVGLSIDLLSGARIDPEREKKLAQLKEQAAALKESLKGEQARQLLSQKIKERANTVVLNGKEAARSSYEIASHMSSFVEKGLSPITKPYPAFLLSRAVVFIPHLTPVDEDDLYEFGKADPAENTSLLAWTSEQFQVTREPDTEMFVDDKPITDYWQTPPQQRTNRPMFVMMTSNELLSTKGPSLFVSRQTPFDSGFVAKSQLFYFAPQCIRTGSGQQVSWSVLARDLVYSMHDGGGQPLLSLNSRWCLELGMDEETCPGLAVEMQVRTPIPKFDPSISGFYLQDPNGGPSIPLYPALPIEMI